MKNVRSREEALDELKRRRKSLVAKAESAEKKLNKMNPENKNLASQTDILNRLKDEIRVMDTEIMSEEASLGDFKRITTQNFMTIKFGGLLECCEKGSVRMFPVGRS
jgi:DNA repair exonuclease SbcCD ATPase subunit